MVLFFNSIISISTDKRSTIFSETQKFHERTSFTPVRQLILPTYEKSITNKNSQYASDLQCNLLARNNYLSVALISRSLTTASFSFKICCSCCLFMKSAPTDCGPFSSSSVFNNWSSDSAISARVFKSSNSNCSCSVYKAQHKQILFRFIEVLGTHYPCQILKHLFIENDACNPVSR